MREKANYLLQGPVKNTCAQPKMKHFGYIIIKCIRRLPGAYEKSPKHAAPTQKQTEHRDSSLHSLNLKLKCLPPSLQDQLI